MRSAPLPHLATLFTLLALLVTGCSSGTATSGAPAASGPRSATVGLTYIPNVQFAPFYVASKRGLFTGADVTLRHHGANEGLFTALAAGQEQFVIAGGDEMLQARAGGMDLVAVAQYYQTYPVTLIVPASSPIHTAADLKGRTVGVPGRFGETWFGLQVALKSAGLSESDVKIQEIGYTQQAALTTGKVDAIVGFTNNDAVQFDAAGVAIREVALTGGDVPLVSICLITNRATLDSDPALVKAVAEGMVAGVKATVDDPAAAITDSTSFVPAIETDKTAQQHARASLDATLPLWRGDGTIDGRLDASRWSAMASFMADRGLLTKPVDASAAVAPDVLG
ncbi:ABC transporter substrate-binding protein [Nigerium massiliense]|uniref:ABC transporter substrate-binding protein n=1 Tax=Nigerium massiliense TaxID=1522317 RepID=UPI00058F2636|nr:ABC transporter substrate-binding protein [Nigerium massiliense]